MYKTWNIESRENGTFDIFKDGELHHKGVPDIGLERQLARMESWAKTTRMFGGNYPKPAKPGSASRPQGNSLRELHKQAWWELSSPSCG